eukprot:XP_014062723.1 PREDICTED: H/ACA ribonucleoprotein complex subunit 3 isoform X1 [Salmo salar]
MEGCQHVAGSGGTIPANERADTHVNNKHNGYHSHKKVDLLGQPTSSAHPARFSPDDKFSRHRVTLKKRFGLLLTQQPRPVL